LLDVQDEREGLTTAGGIDPPGLRIIEKMNWGDVNAAAHGDLLCL
jgi:hypothetical protein